ncbi:hypothetical protein TRAPUB_10147 [Trametes pubescens]|uniref:Uncharacterized protein n=1 Tax=Trametes pubescens TaxID=154538 RepID=A0A1M2W0J9_TRAPU|nr:hypothetical protein TRAPUB_10147 [Trametes pubescens]
MAGLQELSLLNLESSLEDVAGEHEIITAPLLTREAYVAAGMQQKQSQYGVLGSLTAIR